jgi:hypothetical protein
MTARADLMETCALLERVIDLKRENADLRGQRDHLLGLIAQMAYDDFVLRRVTEMQIWLRVTAEEHLDRIRDRARREAEQAAA